MSCPWSCSFPSSSYHHSQMGSLLVRQLSLQVTWRNFPIPSTGHELPTGSLSPAPPFPPAGHSPAAGLHKFTAGLKQTTETQHTCRELRQKNLTLLLWGLCRAAHYSKSQLEPPLNLTTETKAWDAHPNGVQKSAGFHRSQSFQARPRTCTSEQIKTCAAGALKSNPFLQQSRCSGGNTAAPTASGTPQPCTAQRPLNAGCSTECRKKRAAES